MHPNETLHAHFSRLADEELLTQLAENQLTEEAAQHAREELSSRGVSVEKGIATLRAMQAQAANAAGAGAMKRRSTIRRIARFPLRALLGFESSWLVLAVGVALGYPLYRATVAAMGALVLQRPLPEYALPIAYVVLALFTLAQLWLGVSILLCARRSASLMVVWSMRVLGILIVIWSLSSVVNVIPIIRRAAGFP